MINTNDFGICLEREPSVENGEPGAAGVIKIGEHEESFFSTFLFWSREDYLEQWRAAVQSIVEGAEKTALVTYWIEPPKANFIEWWPIYRLADEVVFQNQLFFFDSRTRGLNIEQLLKCVSDYENTNEDGERISEWRLSVDSIRYSGGRM